MVLGHWGDIRCIKLNKFCRLCTDSCFDRSLIQIRLWNIWLYKFCWLFTNNCIIVRWALWVYKWYTTGSMFNIWLRSNFKSSWCSFWAWYKVGRMFRQFKMMCNSEQFMINNTFWWLTVSKIILNIILFLLSNFSFKRWWLLNI